MLRFLSDNFVQPELNYVCSQKFYLRGVNSYNNFISGTIAYHFID
jgi:hypothetical protein